ncbi:MAG TPA: YggT family protein [Actinomycetes bacterium]|jgi:YggT family protein|nr:YggT family protein [Actinomycetes bacterium]
MSTVGEVLTVILWIFLLFLIFRLIMDYVFMFARSYEPKGPMLVALEATYSITDPPLKLLRRYIPPLRFGGIALDLSFLVLFVIVYLLIALAQRL